MRILITGATGYIGSSLVEALSAYGHDLVLASRTRPPTGHFATPHIWRFCDYSKVESLDWQKLVKNIDVVINAVGVFSQSKGQRFNHLHDKAPRALFKAAQQAGVRRIIQISALGTDESATSAYHLSKKQADDDLAAMDLAGTELQWVILRPSLIIGNEGASWRFFQALAALPLVPVIGDGQQVLQPVTIADVCKAVLAALQRDEAMGQRIDLVGSEQVTLLQYLQKLSSWQDAKNFRPLHIAYGPAGILARFLPLLGSFPLNGDALNMLKEARAFEAGDCQRKLGFRPVGLTCFLAQRPPTRAQRNEAGQVFLRPLLRISLAFMWIMAGVASLFLTPHAQSLALLEKLGLSGQSGTIALYAAAILDMALGIALLVRFHIKHLAIMQIALIAAYTLALTLVAPVMWADPFGVLVKNIPLIIATMLMASWQEE